MAGEECKDTVEDLFIPGVSDNTPCPVHRKVWIRKKDGREVCRYCMTGKPDEYYSKVFEVWPPDVTRFLRSHGQKFSAIPQHNPDCAYFVSRFAPHITSPKALGKYDILPGLSLKNQRIVFSVQAGPDVDEVYWFVGSKLVGQGKPEKQFFWNPEAGKWDVSVVDSHGRADKVTIWVFEKQGSRPMAGATGKGGK